MDKKTYAIGILSVTALILFIANLAGPGQPAVAATAVKDRDYQAVTAKTGRGGDALYLTDNRTGMMAVFQFNVARRRLEPVDVKAVGQAFGGGNAGANGGGGGGNRRGR